MVIALLVVIVDCTIDRSLGEVCVCVCVCWGGGGGCSSCLIGLSQHLFHIVMHSAVHCK